MGILIAQALLARGAEPIVVDIAHARLSLATTLGVRTVINPARDDLGKTLAGLTDGAGVDGAILTVVNGRILKDIQAWVRSGGRINIFAGAADGPDLSVDFLDLYHRELAIFSTYSSSPATLADAFALLTSGRVRVGPLISHRLPLSAFDEGVRLQRGGQATKVVFHP